MVKERKMTDTGTEIHARTKRSGHSRKDCVKESSGNSDELVKYMSKLPGYLQRIEKGGESVQSNVLNVGVLDWGRLEKWKHGQSGGPARDCNNAFSRDDDRKMSTTAATSGVVPKDSHRCKIDTKLHTCSNLGKEKAPWDLQHSFHGVRCTWEPQLDSRDSLNKPEKATCSYTFSNKDHVEVNPRKSRRSRSYRESTSGLWSDMGNSGGSLGLKEKLVVRDGESKKRVGEMHTQEAIQRSEKQIVEKVDDEETIILDSESGLTSSKQKNQFSNIVLLRSSKQSRRTLPGETHISLDDNMRVAREVNRSIDFTNAEYNNSSRSKSQIPRSSLSLDLERDCKKEWFGRWHSKTTSRVFDQEMPEDESKIRRNPSPSKRFSFSFGRLSNSFSFKEDTTGQPLSSDDTRKSRSMRFDGSACSSGSSNRENQNTHCRSRVSPLRRLLEPLLKSKGSETILPSKASNPKPTISDVSLQDEKKQETLRSRALLQLTIRNGIPNFLFMVDDNDNSNNNCILGATMESLASSFKDDSIRYCTFFSINEVKAKRSGSWLIQGHKEKQRRFVYNGVGQMKLSNTEQKFKNNCRVFKESILFEFEFKESDQSMEKVKDRRELAAMVIKTPSAEYSKSKPPKTGHGETTLIIPGGLHSFPEKGAPSPLIDRWRSGGLCDCGGWDIGCKLGVFSNEKPLHDLDESFKLFDQEVSKETALVLEMMQLKTGIYTVDFSSSLTPLQAFFVCVTVIIHGSKETITATTTAKSSSPFAPPLSPVGRV